MFVLIAVPSAALMAWLNYIPFVLTWIWCVLKYYGLKTMEKSTFESAAGMRVYKALFWISSYTYILLTSSLAWFLQVEVGLEGKYVLLWRQILGS